MGVHYLLNHTDHRHLHQHHHHLYRRGVDHCERWNGVPSMKIHQHHCIAKCKSLWLFPLFPVFQASTSICIVDRLLKNATSSSSHNTQNTPFPHLQRQNGAQFGDRPKNVHLPKQKPKVSQHPEVKIPQPPVFSQYRHQHRSQQHPPPPPPQQQQLKYGKYLRHILDWDCLSKSV